MINKEATEIIQAEQNCVQRNIEGKCDRDCKNCDLLQDDAAIITAFDHAISALEKQEPMKPKDKEMFKGVLFVDCPICGASINRFMGRGNYCDMCGQRIDWEEDAE